MEKVFISENSNLSISFEFFPPKSAEMEQKLWDSIQQLEPMHPTFVSVTYGAGGTTRERTSETHSKNLSIDSASRVELSSGSERAH